MFVVYWAGLTSSINLGMILAKYVEYQLRFPHEPFEVPGLHTKDITLASPEHASKTVITNFGHWVVYTSGIKQCRPAEVNFEFQLAEVADQPANDNQTLGRMENARFIMEQTICQAIGAAFEVNRSRIEARWGREYRNWPVEMQLFYHCRNASFHGNSFKVSDGRTPAIDPNSPPQWNHLIIPDKGITGSRFAGAFFSASLVLPFLADIGNMLR